jgi:hypothetical protein
MGRAMTDSLRHHRKAAEILRKAAETTDIQARGALIDEALHWHRLALDASGHADGNLNDNGDQYGSEATG